MLQKGIANAFWLKVLMAALMLLDHLYFFLPGMPEWFTWLGRLVAPTFTYLMTQGMLHTSDRVRYIKRMLYAGLVMFAGNRVLMLVFKTKLTNGIFLSLAVSAAILYYCERLRTGVDRAEAAVILLALLAASFFCEGLLLCPVLALIFFYFHRNRLLMCAVYAASCPVILWILPFDLFPQILMVFAVIPILLYNGKRGSNRAFAKYFFYVFYPAHVWALYILRHL